MAGELFRERVYEANLIRLAASPTWTRLEPQSLSGDPAEGLAAAIYDPLWMLGRQWQVGELAGEDVGTPITVELAGTATQLQAFAPGDWTTPDPPSWRALPTDAPLEAMTEAEPGDGVPGRRGAAMAGSALCCALHDAGFAAAAAVVVARCPLPPPDPTVDSGFVGVALLLAGRGADGALVAAELEAAVGLPGWFAEAVPAASRVEAEALATNWLAWYRREVAPPAGGDSSWVGERLEHRFRVSDGGVVLAAPEHTGDEVGWWTFDLGPAGLSDLDLDLVDPRQLRQRVLATPLRFPGMPSSRFWEMEDAQIDLGAVGADPHDLARLLVIECALVFGGDWLVVPFDVPAGSVVRTTVVTYGTTFGETLVAHLPTPPAPDVINPWRMYDVTEADGVKTLGALVVPPTAPGRLEGPALEDVAFLRDEMANLVWAVEHVIEGVSGDPVPVPPGRGMPTDAGSDDGPSPEAALDYVLVTDVPDSWVPYLPHTAGYARVDLVRGSIRRFGVDDPPAGTPQRPRGSLLRGADLATVAMAEVPRTGVRVTRVPVVARTADGTYRAWVARRVRVGRGEGRSSLGFDQTSP